MDGGSDGSRIGASLKHHDEAIRSGAGLKQVFLNSAQLAQVVEVDVPAVGPTDLLVAARASLISTGTETAGYDSGGLVARGMRDPSRIGLIVDSVREHGVEATRRKIVAKKEQMLPRGYSGAGVVVSVGAAVRGFGVGDRVAYAGAPHAEYVTVGQNLAARIPPEVSFEEAAFGALACIALHGVRLGEPTLGEQSMVLGLGLVGLLTAQFARAAGLGVLGVEPMSSRRAMASSLGITNVIDPQADESLGRTAAFHTAGRGVDIVYLCAGIRGSQATNDAMAACRDRGRVIMIGDMGLELDRKVLFSRELEFRVSRSYGPGRYAAEYEEKGLDYPLGYVRWTEGRNLEAFLAMLAAGSVSVRPLISAVLPVAEAAHGYRRLVEEPQSTIAVILSYEGAATRPAPQPIRRQAVSLTAGEINVAVIGAGSFVTSNLLPHLGKLRGRLYGVANRSASAFATLRAQYGPQVLTTAALDLINDPSVDAVIVGTRHNLHAELATACVRAGKPVHVEKPMTMTLGEAEALAALVREHDALLTVGFNRRFAPATRALRHALSTTASPRQFLYRVNAPPMPSNHWSLDPFEGGGRLVGEGCHFIDLVCYLADSEVIDVSGGLVGGGSNLAAPQDNFAVTLRFANGDLGTVVYTGQGNTGLAKERLEVFANGHAWVLDDFETLEAYGGRKGLRLKRADKGFRGHLANFLGAVRGEQVLETTVDDGVRVARVIEMLVRRAAT